MGSQKCENWFPSSFDVKSLVSRVVYSLIKRREGEREGEGKVEMVQEKERRDSNTVKAKESKSIFWQSFFISWMEERCGLRFKREGGLGRGFLMRKGSLVNGQALSKRRSQYSVPKAKLSPSRQTHTQMYIHLQTKQFSWNPINQSPTLLYITCTTICTSCPSHTRSLSTANQLDSQLSLSVPVVDMNWTK